MGRIGWDGEERSGVELSRNEQMGRKPRRGDTSPRWTARPEQLGLRGGTPSEPR